MRIHGLNCRKQSDDHGPLTIDPQLPNPRAGRRQAHGPSSMVYGPKGVKHQKRNGPPAPRMHAWFGGGVGGLYPLSFILVLIHRQWSKRKARR